MIEEKIKSDVLKVVDKKIQDSLDQFVIPLKSQYKVLAWSGTADGTLLAPQFDMDILTNRYFILKSFRIVPYYPPGLTPGVDVFLNDGVTQTVEQIEGGYRINRIFDALINGTGITLTINGAAVVFDSIISTVGAFPLDLWLDNINFKYPAPLNNNAIEVRVDSEILLNLQAATTTNPRIKVIVECYLI